MVNWDLDDPHLYTKFLAIRIDKIFTFTGQKDKYGQKKDITHKDIIRAAAVREIRQKNIVVPSGKAWALRIMLERRQTLRGMDIENVPKLIADAFCHKQILADGSRYPEAAIYPDDTLEHLKILQAGVELGIFIQDAMTIELFYFN